MLYYIDTLLIYRIRIECNDDGEVSWAIFHRENQIEITNISKNINQLLPLSRELISQMHVT